MKIKNSWIGFLSQSVFILTIGFCLYIFIDLLILRTNLLPGVCPVESNKTNIYIAIVLALISFILSVIESWYKKTDQRN